MLFPLILYREFGVKIMETRCQNAGITQDALRYSSSRSNRNFALLEIIPEIHSENIIRTPQGREIEI